MDLKQYFRKLREVESTIAESYPLIVSLETPDGGKPGMVTEVSRLNAARMIIEGRALLASESEKQAYLDQQAVARKAAEKAELAKRVQVAILAEPDMRPVPAKKNIDSSHTGK